MRSWMFPIIVGALLLFALALAGRSLDSPGLYYDEAVQARPALEFATGRVRAPELPGSQSVWLGARRFPLMTQPYMGALKSQALIPSFSLLGTSVEILRATTLIWALCGVAFIAAFLRRAFGVATALSGTALLCFDPSLLLLARHDWGSFALSLLLRGVALWCGWSWWESRRPAWLWIAAFATGLAFYNKVDIAIFVMAVGLALLIVAARPLAAAWREEPRAGRTAAGALAAFVLGLAPMIPALGAVIGARNAFAQPNEVSEKLHTLWTMLDGSHFHRLMETGGMFGVESLDRITDAPGSILPWALIVGAVWLLFRCLWVPAAGIKQVGTRVRDPRGLFLLLASGLSILGLLALPGAVRIHHAMNSYPLLHLLVAYAMVDATRAAKPRVAGLATLAICLSIVATQWQTFQHTLSSFQRTGGKGRWSNEIHVLASQLDESFEGTTSSLDWGFHEPLAFLAAGGTLKETHWQIPKAIRQRGIWTIAGAPGDRYVLHLAPYDRSGFGQPFLEAAMSQQSDHDHDLIGIRRYRDGDGEVAFVSVRVDAPHRITLAVTRSGKASFHFELNP